MTTQAVRLGDLQAAKDRGEKLVMVTAYDATFASLLDRAGAEILLVGDSLGMVVQGQENTLAVTLDQMIYHTQAVRRGAQRAHVVADLPFMSYQVSPEQAMASAGRLMQEGGAHAVKLEGGENMAPTITRLVAAGIPVMGHIGLTPQSVHQMGGFKVQGRDAAGARRLVDDAVAMQAAGCYALVVEGVPTELAAHITSQLRIPTIGIGAGPSCDGQVLVCYDLLGMNPNFRPKFVKAYAELHGNISEAMKQYVSEVKSGAFPDEAHSFRGGPGLRLVKDATESEGSDDPQNVYGVPV
jgi:3-methyl-2-oxobutanoate hydroxymethyltransferase